MGQILSSTPTVELRRRFAKYLVSEGFHIFDVARVFGIAPRVLLAWIQFQNDQWENDSYLGRGPGPDENYVGEWPSEIDEFEEYRVRGIAPAEVTDGELRSRFLAFLAKTQRGRK